jgi:serine/threonine protein kinase
MMIIPFAVLVQIERTLKQGKLNPELIRIVLGCLAKDPDQRFTAARVVADLTEFIHKKGW